MARAPTAASFLSSHPSARYTAIMPAPPLSFAVSLLLLPFLWTFAHSAFVMCSWKPTSGSPQLLNYTLFCTAGLTDNTTDSAYYRCPHNLAFKDNELVAEWGLLALEVLDWGELLALTHCCAWLTRALWHRRDSLRRSWIRPRR